MVMNNKFTKLGNSKRPKSNVVYLGCLFCFNILHRSCSRQILINICTFCWLTYEEVMKITKKVLKKNPYSISKYARDEKKVLTLCYLAAHRGRLAATVGGFQDRNRILDNC